MTIEKPDVADSFSHVDTASDNDGALREFARELVADEMKETHQTQDNDIDLPNRPFLTDLLRNELVNLGQNETRDNIANIKTDTPPPTSANTSEDELKAWIRCFDQMKIKLEYRQRQLSNLEIMKTYGTPAWEEYLARSERMKNKLDQELELLGARIASINAERKTNQEPNSRHLDALKTNWDSLSLWNQMLSEEIYRLRSEISART